MLISVAVGSASVRGHVPSECRDCHTVHHWPQIHGAHTRIFRNSGKDFWSMISLGHISYFAIGCYIESFKLKQKIGRINMRRQVFTWTNDDLLAWFIEISGELIEVERYLPPCLRRHFRMHFLEWKCINVAYNFHWRLFLKFELTIFQHRFR